MNNENEKNKIFIETCDKVLNTMKQRKSIGVLAEKTLHAVLKNYYEPDIKKHEIKVNGYVADILDGDNIYEIQIGNMGKMRDKLKAYLDEYKVTIIIPIIHNKYLLWKEVGKNEYSDRRKSPKTGNFYMIFDELYRIKNYLKHENLRIKIALVDVEEYRIKDGYAKEGKKGSHRLDRIPIGLYDELDINKISDYKKLVPEELEENFTTKDYKKVTKTNTKYATVALNILNYLGVVKRVSKKGNAYVYQRVKSI